MPWCQSCKYEYESNVKKCAECGESLVDYLEDAVDSIENRGVEFVFFINAANVMEADIIISQLESVQIPSVKRFKSSGSYLNIIAGFNYQGIDILVPKVALEEASNVISEYSTVVQTDEVQEIEVEEFDKIAREYNTKRRNCLRVFILILIILPILISLLHNVYNLFLNLLLN